MCVYKVRHCLVEMDVRCIQRTASRSSSVEWSFSCKTWMWIYYYIYLYVCVPRKYIYVGVPRVQIERWSYGLERCMRSLATARNCSMRRMSEQASTVAFIGYREKLILCCLLAFYRASTLPENRLASLHWLIIGGMICFLLADHQMQNCLCQWSPENH